MQNSHTHSPYKEFRGSLRKSETSSEKPGLPVLVVSHSLPLVAAILACVLNIARNEWRDNCEMHWYLMNLTLQSENQRFLF